MTSIFSRDEYNEPYDPFYDPCPYKKSIDEEISVLVDTKSFMKYFRDKENSREYVVYRSIVENSNELFDEFYDYDTHHDSFFDDAVEHGNFYAMKRIYDSGYIKYYHQLDAIVDVLIKMTISDNYEEDTKEFTKTQKYIIEFLLNCLINDYDFVIKYKQFFIDNDNEEIYHTVNEYNKIIYIHTEQSRIVFKICAQKCVERNMCKILENRQFPGGPSIFKYLL